MAGAYDDIETRPWSEIEKEHLEKLQEQIDYLYNNSNFYRQQFDSWDVDPLRISSLDKLAEIPFTTKQDERDCQRDPPKDQPLGDHQAVETEQLNRTISSSGTSGKPTYFGLTRSDREGWNEVLKRFFYGAGIRPDDTVIFGVDQTMVPGGTPYFEGLTTLGANVVPAGGGSTERLLNVAKDVQGDVFFSTVSHARYLIKKAPDILGHSLADLSFEKVVVGGEPGGGNPEIRDEIKDGWGVDVVRETMGLGDVVAGIWTECEQGDGMHFVGQGQVHLEFIDPKSGEQVDFVEGNTGELVYTHIDREATPLLRFRSGDHAKITGMNCSCGRASPKIRCIGRTDDMLIYKAKNVFPTAIRDVISDVEGASSEIRIVVPEKDKVQFDDPIPVLVETEKKGDRSDEELEAEAKQLVRNRLQVRIDPTFVTPDSMDVCQYKTDLVITEDEI